MPAPRATRVPAINMISGIVRLFAVIATPLTYLQIQVQDRRHRRGKFPCAGFKSHFRRLHVGSKCSFDGTLTNEAASGIRPLHRSVPAATNSAVVESPTSARVAERSRLGRYRNFRLGGVTLLSSGFADQLPSQTLCNAFRVLAMVGTAEMNHRKFNGSNFGAVDRHSLCPVDDQAGLPIVDKGLPMIFVRFDGQAQMLIVEPPARCASH